MPSPCAFPTLNVLYFSLLKNGFYKFFAQLLAQDKLLVAIGLLDNTIKVFFDDSLKFFLSLYGHKLPGYSLYYFLLKNCLFYFFVVMCLDISYDNTILISGSADKTIKIW